MTILKAGFSAAPPAIAGFLGGVLGGHHPGPHDQAPLQHVGGAQDANHRRLLSPTGSLYGALVFVGANALVTVLCYLFLVGEIKRFEFAKPVVETAAAA